MEPLTGGRTEGTERTSTTATAVTDEHEASTGTVAAGNPSTMRATASLTQDATYTTHRPVSTERFVAEEGRGLEATRPRADSGSRRVSTGTPSAMVHTPSSDV